MKLSCADFTFPLLATEQAIDLIRILDLQGVDFGIFEGRTPFTPTNLKGREHEVAKSLRSRLEAHNLHPSDVFVQTGNQHTERAANHPDPAQREAGHEMFRRMIDFALTLGASHISGLPGMPFPDISDEDALARAAEESSRRAAWADEAGLIYGIEPHIGSIIATPEKIRHFLKQASGVTLTLDFGHFVYADIEAAESETLLPFASHLHFRGAAKNQLQAVSTENTIDFERILKKLAALDYQGWICLEYVWIDWQGCNRADNLSETILLRDRINALQKQAG